MTTHSLDTARIKKVLVEKLNKLLDINRNWRKWPVKILDFCNIDDDPVQHGLFITPTGNDFIGLSCSHVIRVPKELNCEDYLPKTFHGTLEEFEVDSQLTVTFQDIGFNRHRELEKYSLFSNESIVDFDELFKMLDLKIVEMI